MTNFTPVPDGQSSVDDKRKVRDAAARFPYPIVQTISNGDEANTAPEVPLNFTKGLAHDPYGIVKNHNDYLKWVDEINDADRHNGPIRDFTNVPNGAGAIVGQFGWRGWESPRSGHPHDLIGPGSGEVGMLAAPDMSSHELAVEMADIYGMALLRDEDFSSIEALPPKPSVAAVLDSLTTVRNRSFQVPNQRYLRGSTEGARIGPHLSQFMVQGPSGTQYVPYGRQRVDLDVIAYPPFADYMTTWQAWLDVQQGADVGGLQVLAPRKAMTTPRDLSSYVHRDALYQAYQVATLTLLGLGRRRTPPTQSGFPSKGFNDPRASFATFGDPDILKLVTEVSGRALKAVRRQKFNFHRRGRPERLAAMLNLIENGQGARLGAAQAPLTAMHQKLDQAGLLDLVHAHNTQKITPNPASVAAWQGSPKWMTNRNLLLPMAFVEGSPMHPAYGAGHATVAGACVTVLKTFFDLFPGGSPVMWGTTGLAVLDEYRKPLTVPGLSITGELDKLAANISMGRNMAGVHFYSDYFHSIRMGERIAIGVIAEQLTGFGEMVSIEFQSFDADHIKVKTTGSGYPRGLHYDIHDSAGNPVSFNNWWTRWT